MKKNWTINETQSDVVIATKNTTFAYLGGNNNHFNGFVSMEENEIEDASVEFSLDSKTFTSKKRNKLMVVKTTENQTKKPFIRFKSTSFEKLKNNITFLKGYLTIKDVTKMVELDAEFLGINHYNGSKKVAFEIKGNFLKKDFGFGKNVKFIANLEFSV